MLDYIYSVNKIKWEGVSDEELRASFPRFDNTLMDAMLDTILEIKTFPSMVQFRIAAIEEEINMCEMGN